MARIQPADAAILAEMKKELGHLIQRPGRAELWHELNRRWWPYFCRLVANGHTQYKARDMMMRVLGIGRHARTVRHWEIARP